MRFDDARHRGQVATPVVEICGKLGVHRDDVLSLKEEYGGSTPMSSASLNNSARKTGSSSRSSLT
jgi:hypothetical protein